MGSRKLYILLELDVLAKIGGLVSKMKEGERLSQQELVVEVEWETVEPDSDGFLCAGSRVRLRRSMEWGS